MSDPTFDAATQALEKWRPIAEQQPETSPIVPVNVLAGEALRHARCRGLDSRVREAVRARLFRRVPLGSVWFRLVGRGWGDMGATRPNRPGEAAAGEPSRPEMAAGDRVATW